MRSMSLPNHFSTIIMLSMTMMFLVGCGRAAFDPFQLPSEASDQTPSVEKSQIIISSPNWADGISPAEILVKVRNIKDEPISGVSMVLVVSGSQNTIVPCTKSDVSGVCRCRLYSTQAELKDIWAVGPISIQSNTLFQQLTTYGNTFSVVSAGSDQKFSDQRVISTVGIVEDKTVQKDNLGNSFIHTSFQSSLFNQ